MEEKFYVTTPIYYPNDTPHLGHAYTTIAADVIARWNKLLGKNVFFLTGTDEHGQKIEKVAKENGLSPKEFIDKLIPIFKKNWDDLEIEYDRFIRTTDKDHEDVVKFVLQKVFDNGDIYKGEYEGLYCVDCEAYFTEKDAPDFLCPIHHKPLETMKEESYFFRLSKYQDFLLEFYEKNPEFILPKKRRNEIINRVKEGLRDFSISRKSFKWGIPLPFDNEHVTYVWFDALLNYVSGVGYKTDENLFRTFWPADLHIIGKDIIWFHCVYWPAMLKSAGLEIPKSVFAHGFWTVKNEKMGKSAGNAIKVNDLIEIAGVESARYFLMRATPFGDDGDFDIEALKERHNNELANKLGNLITRVSALIEKNGVEKCEIQTLVSDELIKKIKTLFENYELDKILNEIFSFVDKCNEFVQEKKPWETGDKKVLYELAFAIKEIAILISPFLPFTSNKISRTFNFEINLENLGKLLDFGDVQKSERLFEKVK